MQITGDSLLSNNVFPQITGPSFNWASTPLGDPSTWPEDLKLAVEARLGNNKYRSSAQQNITQEHSLDDAGMPGQLLLQKEIEKSERKFRNIVAQAPVAITIFQGPDFIVELANDAYLQIIDRPHDSFVGRPFFESLPELEGQGIRELLTGVLTGNKAYYGNELGVDIYRYGKKEKRYFNFVYHPLIDTDGKPYGVMVVANDVTEQIVTRHQVEESARQFGNLIKQSPVAMAIFRGEDMIIEMGNDILLKKIWRRDIEEVKGKKLLDVFPELAYQPFPALLHKVYATGIPHTQTEAEAFIHYDDTGLQRYYFDFEYAPLAETDGTTSGIIITVIDVTEKVETRRKIEEAELRLRLANDAAQFGTFDWDFDNEAFQQSRRVSEIFGFGQDEQVTHQRFINAFHPQDKHIRDKAVEVSREKGDNLAYEARIIWPDGSVHWVRTHGKVVFRNGRPSRMYGTVQDITSEKNMLQLLETEGQRARMAIESAQLATFSWNVLTNEVSYSTRFIEIFGYGNQDPIFTRESMVNAIHPDDRQVRDLAVAECLKTGSLYYEVRIIWPDTTIHWIKVFGAVLYNENKQPQQIFGIVQDINKEKEFVTLLAENEDRLRIALESAELGTWDLHLDPVSIFYSPRLSQIFGYNEYKELSSQEFSDHVHPEDLPLVVKAHQDAMTSGLVEYEARIVWKDGSVHWIRCHGKTLYNEKQQPFRMLGILMDITREKNASREIEESEQRLRLATEASALGTFDLDLITGNVIYSLRYLQIMGYNENRPWSRQDFYDHIHPGDAEIARRGLQDALACGMLNYTVRIVWKDGSIHWVKKNGIISYNQAGEPVRMIGTLLDITEERNATAALKESELLFKTISATAPVGLWLTDRVGNCIFVNRMWEEWTGESFENNLGAGWLAKIPQEDRPELQIKFADALINKKHFSAEFRLEKNGYTRWCVTEGYPFYNDEGAFMGFAGSVTDITDRKNTEIELENKVKARMEDLKRSEERHHKMIDEIQDYAILLLSSEGIIQNWNKGAEKIKGYTEQEVIGKSFKLFYSKEDLAASVPDKLLNSATKNGRAEAEGWRMRKDGSRFWASVVITALHDDDDNIIGFTKVTRDLTERKIVEEERIQQTLQLSAKNAELIQQKDFVDVILDSSVDIISVFDTELRYISVNRSFEELYNVSKEQIIGQNIMKAFPPGQTTVFREYLDRALAGETLHGISHKSTITNRHYEAFFIPLKNDNGVYAVLAVAHDNTDILETTQKLKEANVILEEKTQDLQRANAALEKSNSELEQYAYVASHDLQEPLRKIRTYSGMLHESLKHKADEASMATLQKIIGSATRMSNLIYDLLNFSRLLNPERHFEETPLNTVFENIINDFELVIEQKNALVEVGELPVIQAVPLQMNQLFYNLLNNALKFSMDGRLPVIKVKAEKLVTGKEYSHTLLNTNLEYVDITITDNGIGFSQQYAEQIFEVFKRLHTRHVYQGSGIGLALCRRIVLNHQGDIFAEGKENNGSVFHVILPLQQSRM